jgi:hypothetical protein
MACPLRFVLVAASLLTAFVVWFFSSTEIDQIHNGTSKEHSECPKQGSTQKVNQTQSVCIRGSLPDELPITVSQGRMRSSVSTAGRTLVDMFTGKYMYNLVKHRWQNCKG